MREETERKASKRKIVGRVKGVEEDNKNTKKNTRTRKGKKKTITEKKKAEV